VLFRGDPADARGRAFVDVAEQARPVDLLVALEHSGRAGARWKNPGEEIQRFADRPGMRIRPEVANPLAAGTPVDEEPWVFLGHRDREHRIALVIAVADVEPRVELFDPVVLELQRLDLGGDDSPLDRCRRGHHLTRAGVQRGQIRKVRRQP
jgi:hypothetical protein